MAKKVFRPRRTVRRRTGIKVKSVKLINERRIVRPKTLGRLGLGFPEKMIMSHKYYDQIQMTSVSGETKNYVFKTNDLYDPNSTGGGHQPQGFDDMASLYDRYTVIGAKIQLLVLQSPTTTINGTFGVFIDNSATWNGQSPYDTGEQSNHGRYGLIPNVQIAPFKIMAKWSAKKAFGGTIMSNSALSGSSTGSPVTSQYFSMTYQPFDQASAGSVQVAVKITYIAIWSNLKEKAEQ